MSSALIRLPAMATARAAGYPIVPTTSTAQRTLPTSTFLAGRAKILKYEPDFITWSEVGLRSPQEIAPPGYSSWRDKAVFPAAESRGTAVAWRTDRWKAIAKGRIKITSSPAYLDNRWAHWAVLRNAAGAVVSVFSVHAMVNPTTAAYGDQTHAKRKVLFRIGMERLAAAVVQLQAFGPVIVGGDLNSPWQPFDGRGEPWGPQVILGQAGMTSTSVPSGPCQAPRSTTSSPAPSYSPYARPLSTSSPTTQACCST